VLIALALLGGGLAAQAARVAPLKPGYVAPRTPWGDPDLQGVWPSIDVVRVPLERPRQYGTRVMMSPEEQQVLEQREQDQIERTARQGAGGQIGSPGHWVEWGRSQRQTSLLVDPADGRMPSLTADGKARQARMPKGTTEYGLLNGPADFTPAERCISRGVLGSMLPVTTSSGMDITQAPGYVAIRYEMIHDVHVIPLGGRRRLPRAMSQFMGDAHGRWQGDTLVIETTNFYPMHGFRNSWENLKITERITRKDARTLNYRWTVEDPSTFTAPFSGELVFNAMAPGEMVYEYACHEANYGLEGVMSGARAQEREAAKKKTQQQQ